MLFKSFVTKLYLSWLVISACTFLMYYDIYIYTISSSWPCGRNSSRMIGMYLRKLTPH